MNEAMNALALYAGGLGLVLIALAVNVVRVRVREGVLMGDGGNKAMIRAMRGMANFVEFVPLTLGLLVLIALLGAPVLAMHLLGGTLFVGRLVHGWHFMQADAPGWQRSFGALASLVVLGASSAGLILHAII
ncbi:hypothetical protein FHS89_002529 [Rubricella aquisinus]|uniref:Glutathione S-transferase n=1 Tax=Rubricella aquisinus TaxID=2028108 RepID=A0A840WN53_9RHOB|nr:MAPEG family protein [Rubricella aquisinus]MBB5516498.1 hypothetical protein [Rubricella aquisinus]